MRNTTLFILLVLGLMFSGLSRASDPEIVTVEVESGDSGWTFHVALKHPDTGWDHYADGWRVVSADGKEYGMRTLFHPHEHEQPFMRSLADVRIPASVSEVYVQARCKKTGWGKQRYRVKLK